MQALSKLLEKKTNAVISAERLIEVAEELAAEKGEYWPLKAALERHTDMQSEGALAFLLLCPEYLDRLLEHGYEEEFVMLEAIGMAWMAYDMPGLTQAERTRRIELVQAPPSRVTGDVSQQ